MAAARSTASSFSGVVEVECTECPVCHQSISITLIESHVELCLICHSGANTASTSRRASARSAVLWSAEQMTMGVQQLQSWLDTCVGAIESSDSMDEVRVRAVVQLSNVLQGYTIRLERLLDSHRAGHAIKSRPHKRALVENSHSKRELGDSVVRVEGREQYFDQTIAWDMQKQQQDDFNRFLKTEATCCRCWKVCPEDIIQLEECSHRICLQCLKQRALEDRNTQCAHASCDQPVPMWVFRRFLDPSEYETMERYGLDYVLDTSAFLKCPKCNMSFERLGEISDNQAAALESDPKLHRDVHRFRCQGCNTEWCGSCQRIPYHAGFTCSQYETFCKAKHCRFCNAAIEAEHVIDQLLPGICRDRECHRKAKLSCGRLLRCNHPCGGVKGERLCLPCWECEESTNKNDFCNICWVEALCAAPCIRLACGHTFHHACVVKKLKLGYPGARIVFNFMECPLCKAHMDHPALTKLMEPHVRLLKAIKKRAVERLIFEGLHNVDEIVKPDGKYYANADGYAMDRYSFYKCFKCKKPYFGGMKRCQEDRDEEKFEESHLVCGMCSGGPNQKSCAKHGTEYIEYKCKFCCSVATWFCWGKTHFCNSCHNIQMINFITSKPLSALPTCTGKSACPLKIDHPPNGNEFSLGCAMCDHMNG